MVIFNKSVLFIVVLTMIMFESNGQITSNQLENSVKQAGNFLRRQQLPNGSFQDSTKALFAIWETILVTDALLDYYPEKDTSISKALDWLSSNENDQHLICHNVECAKNYCTETSALYLRLLNRFEKHESLTSQLLQINNLQEKDGSWKVGNPDVLSNQYFPSVTAFVINLFDIVNFESQNLNLAYTSILKNQLEDGSWGQSWEYYNCPGYALWQCMPALKNNADLDSSFQRGKKFILSHQLEDGSWYYVDPTIENHVSSELQTALMLTCLVKESDVASKIAVEKGIKFLLKNQKETGMWDGGFFPIPTNRYKKREYLFATSLIFKLLITYQKVVSNE